MKNPLYKRIKRELIQEKGKYIALSLFLIVIIGFSSGFFVAGSSLKNSYDESFSKYNIEDGHFSLSEKADGTFLENLEKSQDIKVYELFYKELMFSDEHTIRIYKDREDVNRIDLLSGEMPKADNEIGIDRIYAENNSISLGDKIKVDNKDYKVTSTVAFSDYSALFKDNSSMMFDANKFTVAVISDNAFDSIKESSINYCYSWVNNDKSLTDSEIADKADDIKNYIVKKALVTDFLPQSDNQSITFSGNDLGKDGVMMEWILYIVIFVLAFIFAVTTRNTIENEAGIIGTLRASGYKKSELFRHYLILPMVITSVSAIIGNICGYTFMEKAIANLYLHSYSLPSYNVVWDGDAFLKTTLVPLVIILIVSILVLLRSLSLSPLKYLRHDLKRKGKKKAVKLPDWKFLTKFRIRIILQNKSTYFLMFTGVFLSSILLLFGMMFSPLLSSFNEEVKSSKISDYQYVLKAPAETKVKDAEKYCVTTLYNDNNEEITVYGINPNSRYLKELDFSGDKIYLSDGYMEKYGVEEDTEIKLSDKFDSKNYKFSVDGKYKYPPTLAVFMSRDNFNKVFDKENDYFTGYFTNKGIEDINEKYIASIITEYDLNLISEQLEDSLGMIFPMFGGFAVILFVLVIYLLAKIVIEKNTQSISMVKILGYNNKEIALLYNRATATVVILSLLISMPCASLVIKVIYYIMMQDFSGWLTYYIAPWIYPVAVLIGVFCYSLVSVIQKRKISRIPMTDALKNME